MFSFLQQVIDLIFPQQCVICHQLGAVFCRACEQRLHDGLQCKAITLATDTRQFLVYAAGSYSAPLVHQVLHGYKYHFMYDLATPIAKLTVVALQQVGLPGHVIVAAVPPAARRRAWRGFDHAALFAKSIAATMPTWQHQSVLRRCAYRRPQVGLSAEQRHDNARDMYRVADPSAIAGQTIVLVDDVMTTGATLISCAQALYLAGAKQVIGVVFATDHDANQPPLQSGNSVLQ